MVVIERASSLSSSSSSRKKEKLSVSCQKDNHGLLKEKLTRKASSLSCSSPSSSRKEKKNISSENDTHEIPKEKRIRRASSLCSLSPSSPKREKRSVSTCNQKASPLSKEKRSETRKSAVVKSKIRDMGPICKKRKEILDELPVSVQVEEDVDICLNKQIQEEGKANSDDCFWLSSGSMSPQEFGLFMSALDPCLDEWVIAFLPKSSRTPVAADGVSSTAIGEPVQKCEKEEEVSNANEVRDSSDECSKVIDDPSYTDSSSFWNMDRTGAWVSLINLDGEDSKWLSDVDSQLDELESDFPSPNWDSYSSDVGFSSSNRSTQENSQSEWSSELLSDSMDWELDSDDPIFWPVGVDFDGDQGWDSFSVSPRKGMCTINFESGKEGSSPGSIKVRIHARKGITKEGLKKKILLVSGLSASKIIEFKKGCRKNAATARKNAATAAVRGNKFKSTIGKRDAVRFKRRIATILENVLEEGKSPKTPTPKAKLISDMLSESTDLGEAMEMDAEGPLFWPSDQKNDWDQTWDNFNPSPRKGTQNTNPGSPKGGFSVSSSVRLKFRPKNGKLNTSGLSASKSSKFKPGSHKTNHASRRRVKATSLRPRNLSSKRFVVVVPSATSMFRSAQFNRRSYRTNASHGKRIRSAMPVKIGRKSVQDLLRLVSTTGQKDEFLEGDSTAEELPIETVMGLNEFDGHEGVEAEFEGESFLLKDCMIE